MLGLGIQAPINANPQEGNVLLAQVGLNPLAASSAIPRCAPYATLALWPHGRKHSLKCSGGVQVENMAYPVTVDPLHTVFSPYGTVQKMAIFEKNNQWQVQHSCLMGWECLFPSAM